MVGYIQRFSRRMVMANDMGKGAFFSFWYQSLHTLPQKSPHHNFDLAHLRFATFMSLVQPNNNNLERKKKGGGVAEEW